MNSIKPCLLQTTKKRTTPKCTPWDDGVTESSATHTPESAQVRVGVSPLSSVPANTTQFLQPLYRQGIPSAQPWAKSSTLWRPTENAKTRKTQENCIFMCVLMNSATASDGKGNKLVFIQTKYKDTFTYPTADNLLGEEETELAVQKSILKPFWYKRLREFSCRRKDAAKERCKTTGGKERCSS